MTRKHFFRALLASPLLAASRIQAASTATPVGLVTAMSDGSQKSTPLGYGLSFRNGAIQTLLPVQYVGVIAVYADGCWVYDRPGRNVEVSHNGLLQSAGKDYALDQPNRRITPLVNPWNSDDIVTVRYLY